MKRTTTTRGRTWCAWSTALLLAAGLYTTPSDAAPAPAVSPVSGGNYTVSYPACGCSYDWLEESTDGAAWSYVGQLSVTFTRKPQGTYYYRVGYYFAEYYWVDYGEAVAVTVGPTVSAEPLSTQLLYRYDTRYGDGNGDGLVDLFVSRVAGGSSGNGTVETLMLLQAGGGRFSSFVPSAAQATAARSWPQAAVQVVLQDFNVDGFVDLLIKGVRNVIGGAPNQIVYAPGRSGALLPLGVRAVDAGLKRFAANSRDYFADTGYFERNAPVSYITVPAVYYYCLPSAYGYDYYYGDLYCNWYVYYYQVATRDYSAFDSAAVDTWSTEAAIEARTVSADQGVASIKRSYEGVVGVPIGGADPNGLNGERARLDDPTYRRGFELFMAVLGIHDANADELDPPRDVSRRPDVVYVTGRRVLGFLPLHTALEYGGSTLSAFDSDESLFGNGVLVSRPNALSDRPPMMMTLGTVSSNLGAGGYWATLVAADARYPDNLPYNPVPSTGSGYNSNGFTHGLVQATAGAPSIDMNKFVGGERPVPANLFH